MPVSALYERGKCIANLRTLLANTPAFQTWTGTANATAAAARVHLYEIADVWDDDTDRPCAAIGLGAWQDTLAGEPPVYDKTTTLRLILVADVPEGYASDAWDAGLDFFNGFESVVEGMEALIAAGGYLAPLAIRKDSGPRRVSSQEQNQGVDGFEVRLELDVAS